MRVAALGLVLLASSQAVVACGAPAHAGPDTPRPAPPPTKSNVPEPPPTTAPPPETPRPSYARADLDPINDWIVGPPAEISNCEAELKRLGVRFQAARIPLKKKGAIQCGTPQAVRFLRAPGGLKFARVPRMSCGLALALVGFERIVQEEAQRWLGRKVRSVRHMGTYNCREMAAYPGWVSEHSYANAIDIKSFVLSDGRELSVLQHFHAKRRRDKAASDFLQSVARRLYDEEIFSGVLTPFFDRAHRNHFHLDLARYRTDASRPE